MAQTSDVDLQEIAREAMIEKNFRVDFPPDVQEEVARSAEPDFRTLSLPDLSGRFWSSIDNDDSRDLDQVEYVELDGADGQTARVYVAIANVVHFVPEVSAIDTAAVQNTTSIYTGVMTFPMLPEELSTGLSSLNEGEKRLAIVTRMDIADGQVVDSDVFPAIIQNQAQLTYSGVSAFLEGSSGSLSPVAEKVLARLSANPDLQRQILAQDRLARCLRQRRFDEGALDFQTPEMRPVVHSSGAIELAAHTANRATRLIEEFMIASNRSVAGYLEGHGLPCIQRVVQTPKNWNRIVTLAHEHGWDLPTHPDGEALQAFLAAEKKRKPDTFPDLSLAVIKLLGRGEYIVKTSGEEGIGHFGLGARNYLHGSAANRRYPDLANQRILVGHFSGAPAASNGDLEALAEWCTRRESDAKKVERQVHKSIAAVALAPRIGEVFPGFITGSSSKGIYVRVPEPPVEGKLNGKAKGLEVGQRVRVRLVNTDPCHGYIDFELADR